MGGDTHRDSPVGTTPGRCRQPLCRLPLAHHQQVGNGRHVIEHGEHHRRGEVVGKVGHEVPASAFQQRVPVQAAGIRVHHRHRLAARIGHLPQQRHEAAVCLNSYHLGTGLGQRQRQRTQPCADLDDSVARADVRKPCDAADGVRIDHEVLTEAAAGCGAGSFQQLLGGGQGQQPAGHEASGSPSPKMRTALAVVSAATWLAGTPRAAATASPTKRTQLGRFCLPRLGTGAR